MSALKIIKPQAGFQEAAIDCPADIAIIGGSAGCGKSFVLLYEPLRYVFDATPNFNGIIFRRESVQISATGGLWDKARELYMQLPDSHRPKFLGGRNYFKLEFPTGFDLQLAHLNQSDSHYAYQGTEICYIAFDELTHFTEQQFFYLFSRNRSTCDVIPYIRASTNPQGSGWVKRLISPWIYPDDYPIELLRGSPIPEMQGVLLYMINLQGHTIMGATEADILNQIPYEVAKDLPPGAIRTITFVAGKLSENQILLQGNPGYYGNLLSLPESERIQLLDGRWIDLDNDESRLYTNSAISDIFSNNFVKPNGQRYLTCDIALEGSDKFVIAVWDGWVLKELRVLDKSPGDEVFDAIRRAAEEWKVPYRNICFDRDGVGGYLKGFLRTAFPFGGNSSPIQENESFVNKTKPEYENLRSQVYFLLRNIIENCEIYIEDRRYQATIEEELRAIRKQLDPLRKLKIIPKATIKSMIGRSPDFADVIAMRIIFDLKKRVNPGGTTRRVTSF